MHTCIFRPLLYEFACEIDCQLYKKYSVIEGLTPEPITRGTPSGAPLADLHYSLHRQFLNSPLITVLLVLPELCGCYFRLPSRTSIHENNIETFEISLSVANITDINTSIIA